MKREISTGLADIAKILLPLAAGSVAFVLEFRHPSWTFWILISLTVMALCCSLYFGLLAMSRERRGITEGTSFYNLQAWACLAGFLLLASACFAMGAEKPAISDSQVVDLTQKIDAASATIASLGEELHSRANRLADEQERIEATLRGVEANAIKGAATNEAVSSELRNAQASIARSVRNIERELATLESDQEWLMTELQNIRRDHNSNAGYEAADH